MRIISGDSVLLYQLIIFLLVPFHIGILIFRFCFGLPKYLKLCNFCMASDGIDVVNMLGRQNYVEMTQFHSGNDTIHKHGHW